MGNKIIIGLLFALLLLIIIGAVALKESGIVGIAGIITVFVALAVGWFITRRNRLASKYMKVVNKTFDALREKPGECESRLYTLRKRIEADFRGGKLGEWGFKALESRLENCVSALRKDYVRTYFVLTQKIKKELNEMLKDGIITEQEYKRYIGLDKKEISHDERARLDYLMSQWKEKDKPRRLPFKG